MRRPQPCDGRTRCDLPTNSATPRCLSFSGAIRPLSRDCGRGPQPGWQNAKMAEVARCDKVNVIPQLEVIFPPGQEVAHPRGRLAPKRRNGETPPGNRAFDSGAASSSSSTASSTRDRYPTTYNPRGAPLRGPHSLPPSPPSVSRLASCRARSPRARASGRMPLLLAPSLLNCPNPG